MIDDGLNAISGLIKTPEGNEFLLQFFYDHPEIRRSVFMKYMNLQLIHNKLDQRFLAYVKMHIKDDYKDFICESPYELERRIELTDLWIAGLQSVNPENLQTQMNDFDQSLLYCSGHALEGIFDERSKLVGKIIGEIGILPLAFESDGMHCVPDIIPKQYQRASKMENERSSLFLQYEDKDEQPPQWEAVISNINNKDAKIHDEPPNTKISLQEIIKLGAI